ncbi:Probable ATP-dependent RNA helicase kurz [Harpegnathos saltator]|uniref:RNA helicase n=2 Tax=Harpegnathos saltator TaxID=610380 RepID=E2BIK3_HARSA|nr:Probable ATP-dependent RNA helicase kurz [Harpegnathos saltator]
MENVEIDNSNEVVVDFEHRADKYNNCNALVLPTKKRETKNVVKKVPTKLLSKKRRKELEKVVERKKKKLESAELLKELAKVQVPTVESQQYVSFTSLQNKGLKRLRGTEASKPELKRKINEEESSNTTKKYIRNNIKGSNKKKRLALLNNAKQEKVIYGPNVLGFEKSDDSDDSSENDTNNGNEDKAHITDNTPEVPAPEIVTSEKQDEDNFTEDAGNIKISNKNQESVEDDRNKFKKDAESKAVSKKTEELKKSTKEVRQNSIPQVCTPAVFVSVDRKPEMQAARMKLPIVAEEQVIVETINENPIVIITGETGSGKTTQVPQFLYEAGYARDKLIGITEPRRVAAMSMSKRVAEEMNLTEKEVSYLIRFEGNATKETKIKFMTDGVLLREIQNDFLLKKYSVIILDEAHERSVHTDILIGLLSRIVPLRNKRNIPLKLIIMSATLRIEEFVENKRLFKVKPPPVITIETRQFPVTIHFNRKTSQNYVNDALRQAIKIHSRLPEGGILVFLTGQQEVHTVVRKLRRAFPLPKRNKIKRTTLDNKTAPKEEADEEQSEKHSDSDDDFNAREALRRNRLRRKKRRFELPNINLDNYSVIPTADTDEDPISEGSDLDEDNEDFMDFVGLKDAQPLWVLPLYSLLPGHEQAKVFEPPPEGCRLCVVSTNVAETSLTIPNIKYVVDSGRCKTRVYDHVTGVSTYQICYVSKAAASQRAGRAGRTGPGHCYRLYSSAVYNDQFEEYSQSEIQRKPVDDLLLQMKAMNIIKVVNFPFPTPPKTLQLQSAEKRLTILGLLEQALNKQKGTYYTKLTPLGRSVAAFPVAPRYGKMLSLSHQQDLLKYTVLMVAALSVQEVLIEAYAAEGSVNSKWLQLRRAWAGTGHSLLLGDLMVLMKAIESAEFARSQGQLVSFCEENGLRHKAVVEIRKIRQQLTNEVNLITPDLNLAIDPKLSPPTDMQIRLLRQIVLTGMADQVAKKVMPNEVKEDQDKSKWKHAYRTPEMEEPVFMHSSCVLRKTSPEWVVYQEVYETNKIYMRGVTAVEVEWLPKFASGQCRLSEPLADPPPRYNKETGKIMCRVTGTFGRAAWTLPPMDIEYPLNMDGVRLFVYFFMDGQVCPKLKKFVPSLLSTPASITKPWAKLVQHIHPMTQVLSSRAIMSKDKLLEAWASDKQFLLSAYQKWLPQHMHTEVALMWPPL